VRIAIMQGRLSASETGALQEFPRVEWEEEFPRAAAAALAAIEWLYDEYGAGANPLETDGGIARMPALAAEHGLGVGSLCAHWFVQRPLLHDDGLELLDWLLGRCARAGIERVVLPFLEGGEITDEDRAMELLGRALASSERTGVGLLVESALEPERLAALVGRLGHPLLGVNYDSGNSAPGAIEAFAPWIRGVHLKDRDESGANVPLGRGTVDLEAVLGALLSVGYSGDLVLETPRPRPGDEVASARRAVELLEQHLR
jgi:hexulose-6-phosphate isomerase